MIAFARGIPAPECLPVHELAECARSAVLGDGRTVLSYGSPSGYEPLLGRAFQTVLERVPVGYEVVIHCGGNS